MIELLEDQYCTAGLLINEMKIKRMKISMNKSDHVVFKNIYKCISSKTSTTKYEAKLSIM